MALDISFRGFEWMFWILFGIIGLLLLIGASVEVVAGAVVVLLGVRQLQHRDEKRKTEWRQGVDRQLAEMREWMEKSHVLVQRLTTSHESRIFRVNQKRAELEKRVARLERALKKRR